MTRNPATNRRSVTRQAIFACALVGISILTSSMVLANVSGSTTYVNEEGYTINRHYDVHQNGALINLWKRNHHPSQDWFFTGDGTIHSASNYNYCLNLHNNNRSNGATINLWVCNGHDSQKWIYQNGNIKLKSDPSFCVNLHNYNNTNGATINLWKCNGHASQHWKKVAHPIR